MSEDHLGGASGGAERIIAEELTRLGGSHEDLANSRKSDPNKKLGIAARLRRETTLPIKEIAARVHLGTSKSANATLHRFMTGTSPDEQIKRKVEI